MQRIVLAAAVVAAAASVAAVAMGSPSPGAPQGSAAGPPPARGAPPAPRTQPPARRDTHARAHVLPSTAHSGLHDYLNAPSFTTTTGGLGPVANFVPKPVSGPYENPAGYAPTTAPQLPRYAAYYSNAANVANALRAAGLSRVQVQQVYGALSGS